MHLTPTTRRLMPALLAAALTALAAPALAGDAALYGPEAPAGSAFVRVFNATPQRITDAGVASKAWNALDQHEASDFVFVPAGEYTVRAGGQSVTQALKSGLYYTATVTGGGLNVQAVEPPDDRLKALIVFHNLTDNDRLQLKTDDGSATIAKAASGALDTREVNPVRVPLAVYDDSQKVAMAAPVSLARGQAFNLFVTPGSGQPQLTWVVD